MSVPSAPSNAAMGAIYGDTIATDGSSRAGFIWTARLMGLDGYDGAFTFTDEDNSTPIGVKKLVRERTNIHGRVVFPSLPGNDRIIPAGSYWQITQADSRVSKAIELAAGEVIYANDVVDDDFPTGGSFTPPRLFFTTSLVRAATTANITIATALNNGDTLDGLTLATGDRVLVKDQSATAQNGVYVVGASPARSTDFNEWLEFPGSVVTVTEGTDNIGTLWRCTAASGGTLGTTAITYVSFSGSSTLTINATAITGGTIGNLLLHGSGDVVRELALGSGVSTALGNTANAAGGFLTYDATLAAFGALTIAANSLTIGSGVDAFSQVTFAANTFPARASTGNLVAKTLTDFALTILDDADATTVRATIGAGTGSGTVTSVTGTTLNGVTIAFANGTTTPTINAITLGAITPTSVNGVAIDGGSGGFLFLTDGATMSLEAGSIVNVGAAALVGIGAGSGLFVAAGKTFSASNTLTFTGTDGSTLNIGAGGTLLDGAFAATSTGGNGAADDGKILIFNALGGITVSTVNALTIVGGAGSSLFIDSVVTLNADTSGYIITTGNLDDITATGTIAFGTWNAGVIAGQYGGTGVANTGKTITLGASFQTTGTSGVTLAAPSTGSQIVYILPTTAQTIPGLAQAQTFSGVNNFSNTTSASSATTGAVTIGNGTAATNVGIGGGNINAGGTLTVGSGTIFLKDSEQGLFINAGTQLCLFSGNATRMLLSSEARVAVPFGWGPGVFSANDVYFTRLGVGAVELTGALSVTGGIVGTTAGGNATAGNVGEYVSASVVVGSATALTTATPKTVTSITLSAGDWDISAVGSLTGASTGTVFDAAIGTTTNSFTGTVLGDTRCQSPTVSLTGADASMTIPAVRVSNSGSVTYYLVLAETFTIGSPAAYGRISARRLR